MYLPTEPDKTPTPIWNPTKKDFIYPLSDDNNEIHYYTMPSRRIVTFPKYIADHLAKHLAQQLASEEVTTMTPEGPLRLHHDEKMKRHLEKIYIKID